MLRTNAAMAIRRVTTEFGMPEMFPLFKGLGDGRNSFVSDFQGSIKGD